MCNTYLICMGHLVGFIILGLIIAAVVGGILYHHFMWNRRRPKNEYRGVRYELMQDCVDWPDMHNAIDVMFEGLDQAKIKEIMSDLWIKVTPYDRPISTLKIRTGFIGKDGRVAAPPKTEEEAKNVGILNGLTEFEKKWPIGRMVAMVYVRQHRLGDTPVDARLLRGTGQIVPDAARSALFHEIAEHVNPARLGEGVNASHSRKDLIDVTKALTLACLNKNKA